MAARAAHRGDHGDPVVLIITNTWNIIMGIFDIGQSVVNQSAGVIIGIF